MVWLMMALTPKRLFLYLCISISLLRPYTLFSRSPLVNKTLYENACELEWVVLYFKESSMVSFGVTVWSWYSGMPAALLYCNSIIACAKAIQDVQLEDMGCSVGEYNINALELEDKMCIRKSAKRIEILHDNKESSRRRSEKEEGKAGKNKLWMRKVQPTKLGPSRQFLVNILLGKWLEMCSFWTKFTSKSCPNLTHRLTLLHDFSVVVGQTPTKVYIFGNCD